MKPEQETKLIDAEVQTSSKQVKKKKTSAKKKSSLNYEKEVEELKNSGTFIECIKKIHQWFTINDKKFKKVMKHLDAENTKAIPKEQFLLGLSDLNIPCNKIEMFLLLALLDPNETGLIQFEDVLQELELSMVSNNDEFDEKSVDLMVSKNKRCSKCKLILWDGYQQVPRFIDVLFRLITFDNFKGHPGHFNQVVHSNITITGLAKIISTVTGIQSTKLSIFIDKSRDLSTELDPNLTLDDYGFQGGFCENKPEELLLYYDYKVEFINCPLLASDYYFVNRKLT